MVKKKAIHRKKVKRVIHRKSKTSKRKSVKTGVLKKDFEVFAKGVQRLEELRVELDNLSTSGYEAEANSIRAKLKNVSYIPQIEEEMRVLKSKISGKYKSKKKKVKKGPSKIHRKIRELEKEIQKRKKVVGRKQLSKEQVKLVKNIPKIENQLKDFKRFLEEQKDIEKRKKEILNRMDPGVSLLVNNKFNLTLNEIKAELSKKLDEKQSAVQKQLQEDLEFRKKNFELQYKALEDKFEEKYMEKVRDGLKNEIRVKFKGALNERVNQLKRRLEKDALMRYRLKEKELNEKESKKLNALQEGKERLIKELRRENFKKLKEEKEKLMKEIQSKAYYKEKKIGDKRIQEAKALGNKKIQKVSMLMKMISNRKVRIAKKNFEKQKQILKEKEKDYFKRLNLKHAQLKGAVRREKQRELLEKQKELKVNISWKQVSDLKEKLKKELESKRTELEKEHNSKLIDDSNKLRKSFHEKILVHRAMLNDKAHEHLTSEIKKLHREHDLKMNREEASIEDMKKRLSQEKGALSRIRNNFNSKMRKLRKDEKDYKKDVLEGLQKEKQEAIKKAVNEQSSLIRSRLKEEFNQRLRLEIKAKEAEFEKRKADLALEVQRRAKELFG